MTFIGALNETVLEQVCVFAACAVNTVCAPACLCHRAPSFLITVSTAAHSVCVGVQPRQNKLIFFFK